MIQFLLLMTLTPLNPTPAPTAQFQPCVWPNKCAAEQTTAQVEICLYPRKCSGKEAEPAPATPVETCVWPHVCANQTPALVQFQPCVWPNRCSKESSFPS